MPSSASLSIVLLASPVRLRRFSSTTPDVGRPPRPPRWNPADGGGDVRGSEEIGLRFRFDTNELTLPPPEAPPRGGREPRGWLSRRCRWRDLDGCHGRNRHR